MVWDESGGAAVMRLRGVRVHNLKGIDLELPRHRWIAVTGVSGSGKSSLAFDTLYAEGQRRYIETFSPFIRQFLEKLDKPDADAIEGLPPAVAVAQRMTRRSARSTVGSVTELQDALALLFARLGTVHCPACDAAVRPMNPDDVIRAIEALPDRARYQVGFPLDLTPETDRAALVASLREQGFIRAIGSGGAIDLANPEAELPEEGPVDVIVDRLVRGSEPVGRLRDSIETAFARGLGRLRLIHDGATQSFIRGWRCGSCGVSVAPPDPRQLRPNNPLGACPTCQGFGRVIELDLTRVVPDPSRSLADGAIAPWQTPAYREWQDELMAWAPRVGLPTDRPFKRLSDAQRQLVVEGDSSFAGLRGFFRYLERKSYKMHIRVFLSRWRGQVVCPACHGARLRPESLRIRLAGRNLAQLMAEPITALRKFVAEFAESRSALGEAVRGRVLQGVLARLVYLDEIGLGYLTLDRPARTLSAGEARRVQLTAALGSGLVNTLYVLDEPSIGLHPRDIGRLVDAIGRLRDAPNSVVVVDHEETLMRAADVLVDIGPGAGESGGRVLFVGPPDRAGEVEASVTGAFLSGRRRLPVARTHRKPSGRLRLEGASGHNLKEIDVEFPLGVFCVVAGVSGSGKSTLIEETLYPALVRRLKKQYLPAEPYRGLRGARALSDVVLIDASPIGRTARSNPATYVKAFDEIRRTFAETDEARLRNYGPGHFSFNVEGGRCSACEGNGYLSVNMQFLPDVLMRCPECRGRRFRPEVLEITYRGKNIAEVLDLTAREAFGFFKNRPGIQMALRPLIDVGLDYLRLGQPASTLSGGEAQRLKLAANLAAPKVVLGSGETIHTLFLLDEPTSGLHPADVARLIDCLNLLADQGHSLIVVTHDLNLMAAADWIIELGPEAGAGGGRVVAEGTPEHLARQPTPTGRALAPRLAD
ncbi:MAG: UvrABC system protein A [Isosphaeraceae bacterium]|jgi:excinuclease ABC subunit A|nr:MAG: UvrABC system protein A [Isosphaeraceae bacterium]